MCAPRRRLITPSAGRLTGSQPIRTERLLLRPARLADAEPLAARRSDPEVAKYQNWIAPYPARTGPRDDRRDRGDGRARRTTSGGCSRSPTSTTRSCSATSCVHLTWEGRTAEIGYTLAPRRVGSRLRRRGADRAGRVPVRDGRRDAGRGHAASRQSGVGDGARARRHAVRGPHQVVVLGRRRELRRLAVRHDPCRLGGVAGPAARRGRTRSASSRSPRTRSAPCDVWRPTSRRSGSSPPVINSFADAHVPGEHRRTRRSCRGCGRSRQTANSSAS